ncbi:MAG: NUDIX hydrolase [Desulfobacterales bacterium]|nr:NUDIX hydrolase [Desulfobacterales bacterium]
MWIEDELFEAIVEKMPIPTVDAIVVDGERFLLLKRNNPPVKGEWWLPRGRVRKGESLEEAVKREVLEETGLRVRVLRQVGVTNQVFPECHTISIYYLAEPASLAVTLNSEHSGYRWVSRLPRGSHHYLKTMIEKAGLPS